MTGLTWVAKWRNGAAEAPAVPPASLVSPAPAPPPSVPKKRAAPAEKAKISAPVPATIESRQRPGTRLAAWLAAAPGEEDDEGDGVSIEPDGTDFETARRDDRRDSGLSDWDAPRSTVSGGPRAKGKGRMRSVY
jgi:hypothetical protein